jgi:hypothetical protein
VQRVEPAVGHRFYHTREKANGKALQRISVSTRATWLTRAIQRSSADTGVK